jgi:hypothetical protein
MVASPKSTSPALALVIAVLCPRFEQEALGRLLPLGQRAPVRDRAAQLDVVPATVVQHRYIGRLGVLIVPVHANAVPVGIVIGMGRRIEMIGFVVARAR